MLVVVSTNAQMDNSQPQNINVKPVTNLAKPVQVFPKIIVLLAKKTTRKKEINARKMNH